MSYKLSLLLGSCPPVLCHREKKMSSRCVAGEEKVVMGRWLLKTEPGEWSWDDQSANGGVSHWDGVRNALAQKHLRAMLLHEPCFFYHSGHSSKHIVGIAEVCRTFYPDPSDASGKHGMVDIRAVSRFPHPIPLSLLKQDAFLKDFILFRQTRLSVLPVTDLEWSRICALAEDQETASSGRVEEEGRAHDDDVIVDKTASSASDDGKERMHEVAGRDDEGSDPICMYATDKGNRGVEGCSPDEVLVYYTRKKKRINNGVQINVIQIEESKAKARKPNDGKRKHALTTENRKQ